MSIQGLGSGPVYPGSQSSVRPQVTTNIPSAPVLPPAQPTTPQPGAPGSLINDKA